MQHNFSKWRICYYCPPFLLHIFFSVGDRILSFELKILGKYLDEEGIRICVLLMVSYKLDKVMGDSMLILQLIYN